MFRVGLVRNVWLIVVVVKSVMRRVILIDSRVLYCVVMSVFILCICIMVSIMLEVSSKVINGRMFCENCVSIWVFVLLLCLSVKVSGSSVLIYIVM